MKTPGQNEHERQKLQPDPVSAEFPHSLRTNDASYATAGEFEEKIAILQSKRSAAIEDARETVEVEQTNVLNDEDLKVTVEAQEMNIKDHLCASEMRSVGLVE